MATKLTSTSCSTLGLISLLLTCTAGCDEETCELLGLPQRWVFINESSETLTLSWYVDDDRYGVCTVPVSSTVGIGERYEVDAYGKIDITSVYAHDTCVVDIQLCSILTMTLRDSTTYLIAPWVFESEIKPLHCSYAAPWLLQNRRESTEDGQPVWTWRLTDAALDSLTTQARRVGLPPQKCKTDEEPH